MAASIDERLDEVVASSAVLPELTGQTLPVRLYGSAWAHRALPAAAALRLAARRGRLEWRVVPRRRAEALRLTERARGVADARFARARLVEDAIRAELQWRPWLYRRMAVEGLEHFESARAARGGRAILAMVHVGPIIAPIHVLGRLGVRAFLPGGDWGAAPDPHGLRGRWIAMQNRWVEEAGSRWVPLGGSWELLRAALEREEVCGLAADAPGSCAVTLAGHKTRVRGGIASLALETGAPIVPVWTLRRGYRFVVTFAEPIDPTGFDDRGALMQAVADAVSPPLVAEPDQIHPYVVEAWGDRAD